MKIKVCPVCNSTDICDDFFGNPVTGQQKDVCNNCGFVRIMTLMEKNEAMKLKVGKKRQ